MGATVKSAYPFGDSSSAPNGAQQVQNLANAIDGWGPEFASTGTRDAQNTSPGLGDVCRVAGQIKVYRSSAWNTVVDSGQFPWTTFTGFTAGWSAIASGVHTFRWRLFSGKVEFDGVMQYTGTITTAGVTVMTTGISQIVNALDANAAAYTMIPCGSSIAGVATAAVYVNPLTDGRLKIMPSGSITNPVICLTNCSIVDVSVG